MMLEQTLYKYFGFSSFRTGQKEVISSLLSGRDTLAMLPTGTGKSLCFQLPGYMMDGSVVIVSPLLSLMQDQVEQMMKRGEKRVVAFNSFLSGQEKRMALSRLGSYKFIFLSPEMLGNPQIIDSLARQHISLLAIDEAHCISQWGYDFRPDYLKLGGFRKKLGNPLTLALTATATPEVRNDISARLGIEHAARIESSVDRPNIAFHIERAGGFQEKNMRLLDLASSLEWPGIIYFSSKKSAEQTAEYLRRNGITRTMPYHGGMDQEQRVLIQQQFLNGQLDIICATSAFGMGVDKENIRFIIHYHMPMQIESYLQEVGRAGRDGNHSIAVLMYMEGDEQLQYHLAEGELPSPEQIEIFISQSVRKADGELAGESLEEAKVIAGFSETQFRWAADFLAGSPGISPEEQSRNMKDYILARNAVKIKNIRLMKGWIDTAGCQRNYFLNYFKEKEQESGRSYCCDSCGLDLNFYMNKNQGSHTPAEEKGWREKLADLLLGEPHEK